MRVPHNSVVMVADGAKAMFFRNAGDSDYLDLKLIDGVQQAAERDGEIKTGPAGQASSTLQGTMGETNFQDQAEARFAADAAATLNRQALAGDYEQLVIVADPKTLGELRKHYHVELERRLVGEIAKDLTGQPVDQIERTLANA